MEFTGADGTTEVQKLQRFEIASLVNLMNKVFNSPRLFGVALVSIKTLGIRARRGQGAYPLAHALQRRATFRNPRRHRQKRLQLEQAPSRGRPQPR